MVKVNRDALLRTLERAAMGLAKSDTLEQSNRFCFLGDKVVTFSDEVFTSVPLPGGGLVDCSVPAVQLLAVLRKRSEEELDIEIVDGELCLAAAGGKSKRRTLVKVEADFEVPVGMVEDPSDVRPLPDGFADNAPLVAECACKPAVDFGLSCAHVTPKFIEACDNVQLARWRYKFPCDGPVLVRAKLLAQAALLSPVSAAVSTSWLHFLTSSGQQISLRRHLFDYPDLTHLFRQKGDPLQLPSGLETGISIAEIFSADSQDENQLLVEMRPGKLRLVGTGVHGRHEEWRKADYDGSPIKFLVPPAVLRSLLSKQASCEVTEGTLLATFGDFRYASSIGRPAEVAAMA